MRAYPFDKHALRLELSTPRENRAILQLAPGMQDHSIDAVNETLFSLSKVNLVSWDMNMSTDTDQMQTRKSAVLTINVARNYQKLLQVSIEPQIIVVFVSWSVLWFPLTPHFTAPKVSVSSLCLLSLLSLNRQSSFDYASERVWGRLWIECWNEACLGLTIFILLLNCFIEIVVHTWNQPMLTEPMSFAAKIYYPFVCGTVIFLCWCYVGHGDAAGLCWLTNLCRIVVVFGFILFVYYWANESKKFIKLRLTLCTNEAKAEDIADGADAKAAS